MTHPIPFEPDTMAAYCVFLFSLVVVTAVGIISLRWNPRCARVRVARHPKTGRSSLGYDYCAYESRFAGTLGCLRTELSLQERAGEDPPT